GCIGRGFAGVEWPGRFQMLSEQPLLLVDGAHNAASMRRLAESIDTIQPRKPVVFVLGFSSDKEMEKSVSEIVRLGARLVVTVSSQARAAWPLDVVTRLSGLGVEVVVEREPVEAISRARRMVGEDGMVCVTGSLYLVADVLRLWNDGRAGVR
ncbi:MAG: hypothetical protein KAQ74_06865, partial [Dehalococcoidia bacterium]|nr:hypothetical protein [Dehalococcoidia bacterium]